VPSVPKDGLYLSPDGSLLYAFAVGIVALRTADHEVLWNRPETDFGSPGDQAGATGFSLERIFPTRMGTGVAAYSSGDGHLLWQRDGGYKVSVAAPDGQVVYAADATGISALTAENGDVIWTANLDEPSWRPVVSKDGAMVFVLTKSFKFHALQAIDGRELWATSDVPFPPLVTQDDPSKVYVTAGQQLCAHDATSGEEVWCLPVRGAPVALSPNGEVIYVGILGADPTGPATLTAMEVNGGKRLWGLTAKIGGRPVQSHDGKQLFLIDYSSQRFRSFDTATGKELWSYPGNGKWPGIALSPDGSIVYTAYAIDGKLTFLAFGTTTSTTVDGGHGGGGGGEPPPPAAAAAAAMPHHRKLIRAVAL